MSEQLDEILADMASTAAGRATAPGAGTARKRGEQRRTRRRLTATALSLALFGLAGAMAATTIGDSRGGAHSPAASGSVPATADTAAAPNPTRYVASGWLSESQLPYAGAITWQVNPQALGTTLHGAVQLILPDGGFFDASVDGFGTYCSIPALTDEAIADQEESFYGPITGSLLPSTPPIPATVIQSTVFYRNESAATAAWGEIGSGFAACAKFETGAVSGESTIYPSVGTANQIVNESNAQCWTNLAAVSNPGEAATDLLDEVCFVRQGTVISTVDLSFEGPTALSGVDFGPVDATVVSNLQRAMSAYSGS